MQVLRTTLGVSVSFCRAGELNAVKMGSDGISQKVDFGVSGQK